MNYQTYNNQNDIKNWKESNKQALMFQPRVKTGSRNIQKIDPNGDDYNFIQSNTKLIAASTEFHERP